MRLTLLMLLGLLLALTGCSTRTVTVTKEVKVPVRCDIPMPVKKYSKTFKGKRYYLIDGKQVPTREYLDFSKRKLALKEGYIKELETSLSFCVYGMDNNLTGTESSTEVKNGK